MYKINIVCVGKLKEKFFIDAQQEYQKRLNRFCSLNIVELNENMLNEEPNESQIEKSLDIEFVKIEPHLKGFVWVCDSLGKQLNSVEFSKELNQKLDESGVVTFVVGSSYGLSKKIKDKYDKISFSKLTFPHHLMRVFLLEQIYRSFCIKNKITYHKWFFCF